MNYLKHYEKLISSKKLIGRKKGGTEYFEKHHIIPKWLGGNNSKDNLVLLTAREHFVAHWLLWKHYKTRPSALAFHKMTKSKNKSQERNFNSKQFEIARKAFSESQTGCLNHMWNKPSPNRGKPSKLKGISRPDHSKLMEGENNPSKRNDSRAAISRALSGKKKSDSRIEIMRINTLNAPKKTCEFCGKHIDIRNYSRWHGDNCKNKNN
jgi:hypothetical protein